MFVGIGGCFVERGCSMILYELVFIRVRLFGLGFVIVGLVVEMRVVDG